MTIKPRGPDITVGDPARDARFVNLFLDGKKMRAIAEEHGCSREYVRQILKRNGYTTTGFDAALIKPAKWEPGVREKVLYWFKRGYDVRAAYSRHKFNSKLRGIEFNLSLKEWLEIWGEKIPDRGQGKLMMCRHGDRGAYEVGNVYIGTAAENVKEWRARLSHSS